eukprot:scaffold105325_cov31-Tisochrysis_lutea.AAC.2
MRFPRRASHRASRTVVRSGCRLAWGRSRAHVDSDGGRCVRACAVQHRSEGLTEPARVGAVKHECTGRT